MITSCYCRGDHDLGLFLSLLQPQLNHSISAIVGLGWSGAWRPPVLGGLSVKLQLDWSLTEFGKNNKNKYNHNRNKNNNNNKNNHIKTTKGKGKKLVENSTKGTGGASDGCFLMGL